MFAHGRVFSHLSSLSQNVKAFGSVHLYLLSTESMELHSHGRSDDDMEIDNDGADISNPYLKPFKDGDSH